MTDPVLDQYLADQDELYEADMREQAEREEECRIINSIPERFQQQRELFTEDYALSHARRGRS